MCERCSKLEQAILDIDAKVTPYGPGVTENGENYATAYIMPAGPLHRALGLVGRCAQRDYQKPMPLPPIRERKEFDAAEIGFTLNQEPAPVEAPRFAELPPLK